MLEFAKTIKELVANPQATIVHKPATQDDPQRRRPDISRAKRVLGWQPQVNVIEGLKKTIDYFRRELSEPTERDSTGHGVGGPYGRKIELPFINDGKNINRPHPQEE